LSVTEPMLEPSHWVSWHAPYDDPASPLSQRLAVVQRAIRKWLDAAPERPLTVISCCAGQGRDLIGALDGHPRAGDVRARLVEADPQNAETARRLVETSGLGGIEVVCGDASETTSYDGMVPADLVLMCGVFGNISNGDIARTIGLLPSLCTANATVVWTRHRRQPDHTPEVRGLFARAGFDEISWTAPDDMFFGVGVARLAVSPAPFENGIRMFEFVGDGHLPA
jgi:hypothetical protein